MKPVAVVTGGRQGIGLGIATCLAVRGFNLVILDLFEDDVASNALAALQGAGAEARFVRADISEVENAKDTVDAVYRAFGRVDVLVNNAGVQVTSEDLGVDVLDMRLSSFDRLVRVNLRGTVFLTQAFARRMILDACDPSQYRAIITISTISAELARKKTAEYCLSKTGLSMMNKIFALRLAPYGIGCFEVLPGLIDTAMTAHWRDQLSPLVEQGLSPITRWGLSSDVGHTVAALATGAFPFSTGEAIHVDGGMHIPSSPLEPGYMAGLMDGTK